MYTPMFAYPLPFYSRGGIKAQRVYCKALYKNISAGRIVSVKDLETSF
ncbi:hypothetical protein HMPREF0742_00405 [Rothia aeria F0184]|uniref:Uncharacterized protein n=1 Tax=Rothia aeria F0184 TaxID=888019 RepID=U7V7G2_9MICC|nr:hypothetical protein HMPREF0742_00405 [Rothia aeria F0184]